MWFICFIKLYSDFPVRLFSIKLLARFKSLSLHLNHYLDKSWVSHSITELKCPLRSTLINYWLYSLYSVYFKIVLFFLLLYHFKNSRTSNQVEFFIITGLIPFYPLSPTLPPPAPISNTHVQTRSQSPHIHKSTHCHTHSSRIYGIHNLIFNFMPLSYIIIINPDNLFNSAYEWNCDVVDVIFVPRMWRWSFLKVIHILQQRLVKKQSRDINKCFRWPSGWPPETFNSYGFMYEWMY